MPRHQLPFFENVTILDAGAEGKAVARVNDLVVFVPFCVPGDVVDIQVISKRKSYCEGKVVKFHHYSELRVEPFCEHFGTCGGCRWQNISYEQQLKYKQKQIDDHFTRIGKFSFPEILPILASPLETGYRNKLEYTFSDRRWLNADDMALPDDERQSNGLGFHIPTLFDRVLDIKHCYHQPEPSNAIRLAVRDFTLQKGWSFYNPRSHEGFMRNLLIRNTLAGDWMVIVVFAYNAREEITQLMTFIAESFPQITSLIYVVNTKQNDVITDQEMLIWKGEPFITEAMDAPVPGGKKLQFRIGPVSFYQTNPLQAYYLYKTAFKLADFKGDELVYDLYCGTGTITNFVAPYVKKSVGVEYVPSAIDDAHTNSELNQIENTTFFAGDLAKVLNADFVLQNGRPDVIITDPPRSGMHENVVKQILQIEPEKVVYVSCNTATQARDIALMTEKYEVTAVQPVDMFPHTHHVENVVLLTRRK
ncbi:MAG: 23S rRNA (uracil(1939)-C(5))-methyltransferase RlmD [Bacteroidota bacterium]